MQKIDSKYNGCAVYTRRDGVQVYKGPGTQTGMVKRYDKSGTRIGYIYGYHPQKINNVWWYIIIPDVELSALYVYLPLTDFEIRETEKPSLDNVHYLLDRINLMNVIMYKRLLVTLYIINKYKQQYAGDAQRLQQLLAVAQQASELGKRLQQRISNMQHFSSVLTVKNWIDSRYEWLKQQLGLGAVPAMVVFAIGAAVSAAVVITLYFLLKPTYDVTKADLVISDKLQQALDTLKPEDRQAVIQDLEKQIDDAYNQGKEDQATGGLFGDLATAIKWAAIGFIGYKALDLLTSKQS